MQLGPGAYGVHLGGHRPARAVKVCHTQAPPAPAHCPMHGFYYSKRKKPNTNEERGRWPGGSSTERRRTLDGPGTTERHRRQRWPPGHREMERAAPSRANLSTGAGGSRTHQVPASARRAGVSVLHRGAPFLAVKAPARGTAATQEHLALQPASSRRARGPEGSVPGPWCPVLMLPLS